MKASMRIWLATVGAGLACAATGDDLPDIRSVPADLVVPAMVEGTPTPGRRVRATLPDYAGTDVHHTLYLPTDWMPGRQFPVIVEYAGNGPYRSPFGDICTGRVEDCCLGYGLSGGRGFIWLCLPYVSHDRQNNQRQWWGDVEATLAYCHGAVTEVCERFGGDRDALILAGFSRGAIACNYLGLRDDQTAGLWRAFFCHSHYDGVQKWAYADSDRASALTRLRRLGNRPQFISQERSVEAIRRYLAAACPQGDFTFQVLPYRNHTDRWILRDIPERRTARAWLRRVLAAPDRAKPAPVNSAATVRPPRFRPDRNRQSPSPAPGLGSRRH